VYLHAAIGVVAHPAGDPENVRFPFHEPAEADTLHASGYHVTTGFEGSHEKKQLVTSNWQLANTNHTAASQ
jgi:hypothetical protein